MRITIDNLDDRGAVDYTAAVAAEGPITVQRTLNAPSRCTVGIVLGIQDLPAPSRKSRVVVTNHAGVTLFTGYLPTEPVPVYAGAGIAGPLYRVRLSATSDEWLLDKQGSGASSAVDALVLEVSGASLVEQLTQSTQTGQGSSETGISVTSSGNPRAVGVYAVSPAATWSTNAAAAANATYAAYRAVSGTISVATAGSVTHVLSEAEGTLDIAELSTSQLRELANDVTISGEEEAGTYVQEILLGDGTTTVFDLSSPVLRGTNRTLLIDSFDEAAFDTSQWALSDGANHLQLTSAGLTMSGGNGFDGQTTLGSINSIEMSGFLLAQASGVLFGASSDGMLAGFYSGASVLANCFAGFRVRQSSSTTGSVTVAVPVVNGAEQGTVFTPITGHSYTLRLRLYCVEMQRVPQRYYCMVDGVVQAFGQISGVSAPMHLVFEVLDEGASSNTPATVLYDTEAAGTPVSVTAAACSFLAVNSTNLYGSMASLELTRPGSAWVSSTLPNGTKMSRLIGSAGQGVDCELAYGSSAGSKGSLTFFAGRIPQAGEAITVCYRVVKRSVARLADAASVSAEAAAGMGVQVPGVSRWLGKVNKPAARSSADCEAAAQAVLAMATARDAAISGTCNLTNPDQDIWPGDLLQVSSTTSPVFLLVRSVVLEDSHALPELVQYRVSFANDWATELADGMGLSLSEAIASDALLPQAAAAAPAQVLSNLQQLSVVSLSNSAIQIDAGCLAPSGGGFEVRRRAEGFGIGVDSADLVLRSPVRSFSIPRSAQVERYFVRMYDATTPPLYSRFSSALYINWPLN